MYYPITEDELKIIKDFGRLALSELPDEDTHPSCVKIFNQYNPTISRGLFKFHFSQSSEFMMFTDLTTMYKMPTRREYEKCSIVVLEYFEKLARMMQIPKLFVQSSDSRIIEGFYARNFGILDASEDKSIMTYAALKELKTEGES